MIINKTSLAALDNLAAARDILLKVVELFSLKTGFTPITATETEFYLTNKLTNKSELSELFKIISDNLNEENIPHQQIKKEVGDGQFEIALGTSKDPIITADNTIRLREIIKQEVTKFGFEVDFSSKPDIDDMGSSMQIHISLSDEGEENLFITREDLLLNSIAGILELTPKYMIFFAPRERDYRRFRGWKDHYINW